MSSATTAVAVQYRLQEWTAQIRECQNRPAGMSVVDWCASHGITEYSDAAEPPVRCGVSHLSGQA